MNASEIIAYSDAIARYEKVLKSDDKDAIVSAEAECRKFFNNTSVCGHGTLHEAFEAAIAFNEKAMRNDCQMWHLYVMMFAAHHMNQLLKFQTDKAVEDRARFLTSGYLEMNKQDINKRIADFLEELIDGG